MRICFVTSEVVPFAKAGGLGDVSRALPVALARLGCEVKIVMPLYHSINTIDHDLLFADELYESSVSIGDSPVTFNVWYRQLGESGPEVYFVDCPHYYHRAGIYTNDGDEGERFILLQKAAFSIMQRYGWAPDILHANDWPTGLAPAMLRESYAWDGLFENTASVLTIHNIGYQGLFDESAIYKAGLPAEGFHPGGPLEHNGAFSFLKTGLMYADAITAVSPTYANEIRTPEYGAGLDHVLRLRGERVFGILNGIDLDEWNPANDDYIPVPYDANSLDQKEGNKAALLSTCGLPYHPQVPVVGIVSRLVDQKGLGLLYTILGPLLESQPIQFVVLGSGQHDLEEFFRSAQAAYPGDVHAHIGYSESLAHQIEAGADMFLMPSAYEPCGLNQMYSLRYGTVPVVRKTGGLADTVVDHDESGGYGTGFSFYDFTPEALWSTLQRALARYQDPTTWRGIQLRGMSVDVSWERSGRTYLELYDAVRKSV